MDKVIKERIDEINNPEAVRWYFNLLKKVIQHPKLDLEQSQLYANVFHKKTIATTLGHISVLSLYKEGEEIVIRFMIRKVDYTNYSRNLKGFKISLSNTLASIDVRFSYIKNNNISFLTSTWVAACIHLAPTQKNQDFKQLHKPELFEMALDKNRLDIYVTGVEIRPELDTKNINNQTRSVPIEIGSKSDLEPIKVENQAGLKLNGIENQADLELNGIENQADLELNGIENQADLELNGIKNQADLVTQIVENQFVNMKKMSLNQILYGPPGTGKTYHTIYRALEIIGFDITGKDRKTCKAVFDEYVKIGQIVFTTFHQSMNYEDFIEGIKPVEIKSESESLSYKVEAGIFKRLAIAAAFEIAKAKKLENTTEIHDFSSQYDHYINGLDEKLLTGQRVRVKSRTNGDISIDNISQNRNIIVKHLEGARTYTVSKERLMKLNKAFPNLETVQNIHTEFQEVIGGANMSAYWAILNDIRQNLSKTVAKTAHFTWEEQVQVVSEMQKEDFVYSNQGVQPANFVLIIDEINRGNVSQIFGELITLIEDDKRLGKEEALQITLPYSKQLFGIPPNLYIIGNMNTADRSVEALDTALRRRFVFEEMMPQTELLKTIDSIDLANLLKIINERIEILLNRDNLIGHSYFLKVTSLEDLQSVFFNNIIPLLQEYFYGDYGKMGLVLGNGFVRIKKDDYKQKVKFANFFYEDKDLLQKNVYEIISNKPDFDIKNALTLLLNE